MVTNILCFVFFLSGASALIFEALWFQLSGLTFGNSVWATTIVLSSFMGGLALGNFFMIFKGSKIQSPVRFYATLEIIIGIFGVGLVFIFPKLTDIFAPLFQYFLNQPFILNFIRAVIAIFLMLAPATAMGMTLPVLVKTLYAEKSEFGFVLGKLYGWNTLGATVGVLVCEMFFIKWFGIRGTSLVAAGCNAAAAITAIWLSDQIPIIKSDLVTPKMTTIFSKSSFKIGRLLSASFLSGFTLLALEVIWFRFMILFFISHGWNFAVMLAVVLSGISLGGLFASKCFQLKPETHTFLMPVLFFNGILLIVLYTNFGFVVEMISGHFTQDIRIVVVSIFLMFPVSFISGIVFTMLGQVVYMEIKAETEATGLLTLANTMGGMLGSLMAGLILIPFLGIEKSFFLLACIYGFTAFLIYGKKQPGKQNFFRYATIVTFIVSLSIFPFGLMNKQYLDISIHSDIIESGEKRVAVKEGLTETIQYFKKELLGQPYNYRLITNSHSMSGTHVSGKRYMKLFVYWPIALNPESQNALLICFGCGSTAKALTDTQALKKIDIVDISKDIIEMSKIIFTDPKENPINDPRVRIHIEDGRFFLRSTKEKYDLITAEPPPPVLNGIVNLYTQEYFQLIYDRLSDGGIVTYWLPVYQLQVSETKSILKGFSNVFNNCSLWTGSGYEWMMVGIKNPKQSVSENDFVRQWNDPQVGSEMHALGFESPEQFGSLFIVDGPKLRDWISDSLPLVDNFPRRLSYQNRKVKDLLLIYKDFMNDAVSHDNFMKSEFISNYWPESLKWKTEKYFTVRQTINEILMEKNMRNSHPLEILHHCLHEPLLENYIIWAFRSDQFAQEIIENALKNKSPDSVDQLEVFEHLAAGAASKKNYRLAETYMHLAINHMKSKEDYKYYLFYTIYRMYFLLLDGDKEGAIKAGKEYIDFEETGRDIRMQQIAAYWNPMIKLINPAESRF